MKVLEIAPIEEPVPPRKYGGTEWIVYHTIKGLVDKGHDVYTMASADSQLPGGELIPVIDQALRVKYPVREHNDWRQFHGWEYTEKIISAVKKLQPDVIHNHIGPQVVALSGLLDVPMVTTCHGPMNDIAEQAIYRAHPEVNFVSISNNQRKALPDINWLATVYNGIPIDQFEVGPKEGRDYFAFLGRINPDKGIVEACRLIKNSSYKLKIAAKIDMVDRNYWEQEVAPLVDGKQIEYIGEIGPDEKREFLKKAKGLLMWLNWEEPFGLVVTEAMASGTPVLTNKRGSMSELVVDGETGFLVDSLEEMRSAMDTVHEIDPIRCRRHVARNFSDRVQGRQYEKVLQKAVDMYANIRGNGHSQFETMIKSAEFSFLGSSEY